MLVGVAGLAQLVAVAGQRLDAVADVAGSAWSRSQFGVSMMWASASWTTRSVM
jgi:hypothetical protein